MGTDRWEARAACNQHEVLPPSTWDVDIDGELQFPQDRRGARTRRERWRAAVSVCNVECPVRDRCRAESLGSDGVIRGGKAWGRRAQAINTEIYRDTKKTGRKLQAVA